MDYSKLTKTVQEIHMPEEMRHRIAKQVISQQKSTPVRHWNPGLAAAVIALLLCIPLSVTAAGKKGIFKDVKNWYGAVTGNVYNNASEEIQLSAVPTTDGLLVTIILNTPEERPYRYMEELAIGSYRILDGSDKVIGKEEASPFSEIQEGLVNVLIPLPAAESGTYQLEVHSFTARAKGEQDLPIYGQWTLEFTTEP